MKELTYLENKIITAIAETHPYTFMDCERVYRRCKSFDKTIKILQLALMNGTTTDVIIDVMEND